VTLSVLAAAAEEPDRVALVVGDRTLTFRELGERALRAIAWLGEQGVAAGGIEPVALVGRSDLGTLVILYALLEIARPVALLHPRLTDRERADTVSLVEPVFVLENAPTTAVATASLDDFAPQRHPSGTLPLTVPTSHPVDPESCLAILFTSGTTGDPKGVVLSRRAFVASARASADNLGFRDDDRWLLGLPMAHVGGLSVLTRCLLARRTVVVPEAVAAGQRLSVEALAGTIESGRVTLVSLVPTQLEWLLAHEPAWTPPPYLRAVLLGGAAAPPTLLERARSRGVPVLTTYGLTEACSQVTTEPYGKTPGEDRGSGTPMSGTEVRVVEGVICVRGPTLFSGYLTRGGAAQPFDAEGFFHTDDLGRLDAEGRLHVLGRRSDRIVTGGENVYPAEVEAVLERCPGVGAACVFGVADDAWGEIVVVAIVPSDDRVADAALANFVRTNLAAHRRPRRVAHVAELAATPAGKLDRRETARAAAPHLRPLEDF
jgi:O-succinylbenzoic acid--CoA ligase